MTIYLDVLVLTCFVEFVICLYSLTRIEWVGRQRVNLINSDYLKYKTLPKFCGMADGKYFWCWDIDKMIKMEAKNKK